jgi:hypothetical protein
MRYKKTKKTCFGTSYIRFISIDLNELPTKLSGSFVLGTTRNHNRHAASPLPCLTTLSVSRLYTVEKFDTITTKQK